MKLLNEVQQKLKAPKGQKNTFGNYNYRSCEDILEAVKPLLADKGVLVLYDEIIVIGTRFYVKATATLHEIETKSSISVVAFARESETKKGMDESQITGASSSYARKYALNGLFCIDDSRDADTEPPPDKTKILSSDELLEKAYLLYQKKHNQKIDRKAFKDAVIKKYKKLPTRQDSPERIVKELPIKEVVDEEAGMMSVDEVTPPPIAPKGWECSSCGERYLAMPKDDVCTKCGGFLDELQ